MLIPAWRIGPLKGHTAMRTHETRYKNTSWKGPDGNNPSQELLHRSSADWTD